MDTNNWNWEGNFQLSWKFVILSLWSKCQDNLSTCHNSSQKWLSQKIPHTLINNERSCRTRAQQSEKVPGRCQVDKLSFCKTSVSFLCNQIAKVPHIRALRWSYKCPKSLCLHKSLHHVFQNTRRGSDHTTAEIWSKHSQLISGWQRRERQKHSTRHTKWESPMLQETGGLWARGLGKPGQANRGNRGEGFVASFWGVTRLWWPSRERHRPP